MKRAGKTAASTKKASPASARKASPGRRRRGGGIISTPAAGVHGTPPTGWRVESETRRLGGIDRTKTYFVTRTKKQVQTMEQVHHHLTREVAVDMLNEDEELWLHTLQRYGLNCRH